MGPSASHDRLTLAVEHLRDALLPSVFDPTGTYAEAQAVHLRSVSFRVLAHAEIEAYLEDIALELLEAAWTAWTKRGIPSVTGIALLAFSGREHALPPSASSTPNVELDASPCLQKAQGVWRDGHRKNHGLKEENVLRLFLPLGVRTIEIDPTLLADLSSFGAERGAVAHSATTRIIQFVDPETEYRKVRQLCVDLVGIDSLVQALHVQLGKIDLTLCPPQRTSETTRQLAKRLKARWKALAV